MKILGPMIAILIVLAGTASPVDAKKADVKKTAVKKAARGKALPQGVSLQTDIQFNASTLHGRYQTPAEALAKVEDEKNLNDLLTPRTHFKDRMAYDAQGNR